MDNTAGVLAEKSLSKRAESREWAEVISMSRKDVSLTNCRLCPRECGVDRQSGKTGYCGMNQTLKVARAALHMREEYS